jgi:radical SAM protein with 4Fe4S-binding SPASM domain
MQTRKLIARVLSLMRKAEISRKNLNASFFSYQLNVVKRLIISRLLAIMSQKRIGFSYVCVETYAFCNRKCHFCFNHERFPKRERGIMSEETFIKIISQLSEINFCGSLAPVLYGEPLLDKRLPRLMKYYNKNIRYSHISIYTNGDMLNEEIFRNLIDNGVQYFLVTNYDNLLKPELNFLKQKYPFHIKLRNERDLIKIDRAGKIFQRNIQLNSPCLRPSREMVINWKGDILLCCQDFYGEYVMGNVHENSLLEIWNNEKFVEYRSKLSMGQRSVIPICKYCEGL